jgi:hypothetical protein
MSRHDVAWTTAATAGLACAAAAALAAWTLLTDPLAVVTAVSAHDASALVDTAVNAMRAAVSALWTWL